VGKIIDRALLDSTGSGVSFRVIDSLWTTDSGIVVRLMESVNNISMRQENNGYFLKFMSIAIKPYKEKTFTFDNLFKLRTHSYIYFPSTSHRFGIQLDGSLFSMDRFVIRIEATLGLESDRAPFSDINYNIGFGYKKAINWMCFKTVIGYGIYAKDFHGQSQSSSVVFLGPTIQMRLNKDINYLITIGTNIFLYQSIPNNPRDKATCYLGIGFQL
jgi:hypothetical protein